MTDSSSDEEDNLKILQAIDKEFISDSLYKDGLMGFEQSVDVPNSLPSLRYSKTGDTDQCNVMGLNVTPEFQNHVAKHLYNLLDKQLKEITRSVDQITTSKGRKRKTEDTGVRLLYSSTKNISFQDSVDISKVHNAKWKSQIQDIDSEEENVKISESAVCPEWILSGEAVKGWVKSTKGEVVQGMLGHGPINLSAKKKKKKRNNEHVNVK